VRLLIRDLYPAIVRLAQRGGVAYRCRYGLNDRHRATAPNAMWQAHYTMLDILIVDANGTTTPPWHTVIMDDYSGYLVFLGAPSGLHTSLALRQAVLRKKAPNWPVCGIPEMFSVDHGSELTSEHLDQAAAALWFQIIYSAVARPQMPERLKTLICCGWSSQNPAPCVAMASPFRGRGSAPDARMKKDMQTARSLAGAPCAIGPTGGFAP